MKPTRALFLDRDGILNRVVMREGSPASPRVPGEFELLEGAADLVRAAREAGWLTIVVTNQPDIGRGLMRPADLEAMHRMLADAVEVDDIEVCTDGDDTSPRRKPNPGMLLDAAAKWGIHLGRSWLVGDSGKDLGAGRAAGVRTILLETPYNRAVHGTATANFSSLREITEFIIKGLP